MNSFEKFLFTLTTGALLGSGVKAFANTISQSDVENIVSSDNFVKHEQSFDNQSFQKASSIKSSIRDDFKKSSESKDEQDIQEQGIENLINLAKQDVINYINEKGSLLTGEDKSFLTPYLADLNNFFTNADSLESFYSHDWKDDTFENEVKNLINNHNVLTNIQFTSENSNESGQIDSGIPSDANINNIDGGISNYPSADDKTSIATSDKYFLGISQEVWKLGGIVTLGILASAFIIAGTNKLSKKISKEKDVKMIDSNYFVGRQNNKSSRQLARTYKEITKTEEDIKKYKRLSLKANKNKSKIKYEEKVEKLKSNITLLYNERNKLRAHLNSLIVERTAININNLKRLMHYTKSAKTVVSVPEHNYSKFGKSILKDIKRYSALTRVKKVHSENKNKIEEKVKKSNFITKSIKTLQKPILKMKSTPLLQKIVVKTKSKLASKKAENITKLQSDLINKLKNSCLTGQFRVSLNEFLNNSENLFEKENLSKLKVFSKSLKVSNQRVFDKTMNLLNKAAKAEYYTLTENQSKFNKNNKDVKKIQHQLSLYRTNFNDNYYGNINNIKGSPINPNRFICLNESVNSKSINEFFDKVVRSDINKDKLIYELTITSNSGNEYNSLVCSFDNKKSLDLMKAKMLIAVDKSKPELVEMTEKTIYFDKKFNSIKTIYDLKKDPSLFERNIQESKAIVSEFETSLEYKEVESTEFTKEAIPQPTSNRFKTFANNVKEKAKTKIKSFSENRLSKQIPLSADKIAEEINLDI